MDATVFGDTLVRYAPVSEADQKAYTEACEKAKQNNVDLPKEPSCYKDVHIADLPPCQYVTVLFTAEYCPPCQAFAQPFQEFVDTVNKDSNRMQVVVVNCDKRREEFDEHVKKLSDKFLCVPFEQSEVAIKLEDMA
mgnify:FL=1